MTAEPRVTLDALNQGDRFRFVRPLLPVFENATWMTEAAFEVKPFPTVTALHQALFDEILDADEALQIEFLNGHPDLAGPAARRREMLAHSTAEQGALGLDQLDEAEARRFAAMNAAYRARFGFPFILCVRRHTHASILREFTRRLAADPASELAAALQEVFWISRLRLVAAVEGPGMPIVAGGLSTHVLDTAQGRPGAGIRVEIAELDEHDQPIPRNAATTDEQGRVTHLLDDGGPLRIGRYELRFHVGDHFAAAGVPTADPPYLDIVPVRIAVADAEAHYHVPLLVSPYAYTTYRGS